MRLSPGARPAWRATALAALAAAGAVLLPAARCPAGEPVPEPPAAPAAEPAEETTLPAGTEVSSDVPPLRPSAEVEADPGARARWVQELCAVGRAEPGTRRAAACLLSAAAVLERHDPGDGSGRALARSLYAEAVRSAPEGDPLAGLGAARVLELALDVGEVERARQAAAWLEAWAAGPRPLDPDATDRARSALLETYLRTRFPLAAAEVLAGLGRWRDAAARLRPLHQAPPPDLPLPAADVDERLALYEHRAGLAERARNSMAWAFERTDDPAQRARAGFWLLHQQHGLLDAQGRLAEGAAPALAALRAAALREPLRLLLERLAGNPHVIDHLLALGSAAVQAGADEAADLCYALAEREPALGERMLAEPLVRDGLLPHVLVLLRLGRPDDADDLLARITLLAGGPPPLADALRVRIALAREEQARREEAPGAPEAAPAGAPEAGGPEPRPARTPGLLVLPPRASGPVDGAAPAAPAPAAPAPTAPAPTAPATGRAGPDRTALAVGLGALAAMAALLLVGARRRRAARGPRAVAQRWSRRPGRG